MKLPIDKLSEDMPEGPKSEIDLLRKEIVRAIDMIHRQDKYEEGMALLCRLAGLKEPNLDVKPVSISDMVERGPSLFSTGDKDQA